MAAAGNYQLCWAPSWQRPSELGCSELGWESTPEGSPLTCSQTKDDGVRCGPVTFPRAETICTSFGARLCLPHEITQGETRGTGCDNDNLWTWTSQSCGP